MLRKQGLGCQNPTWQRLTEIAELLGINTSSYETQYPPGQRIDALQGEITLRIQVLTHSRQSLENELMDEYEGRMSAETKLNAIKNRFGDLPTHTDNRQYHDWRDGVNPR